MQRFCKRLKLAISQTYYAITPEEIKNLSGYQSHHCKNRFYATPNQVELINFNMCVSPHTQVERNGI